MSKYILLTSVKSYSTTTIIELFRLQKTCRIIKSKSPKVKAQFSIYFNVFDNQGESTKNIGISTIFIPNFTKDFHATECSSYDFGFHSQALC